MKIYTRTGDDGGTALFGGGRVRKHDARVGAYGDVDELNSVLGWALTQTADDTIRERLGLVQHDLFAIGAELATPPAADNRVRPEVPVLPLERVATMERWIDESDEELPALRAFIVPGGGVGAAALHVARTVCRRAERSVVELAEGQPVDADIMTYLNRLSDLLFTFARLENHRAGRGDVEWVKPSGLEEI
jgi:cob(I)alamin adenosyltransferase